MENKRVELQHLISKLSEVEVSAIVDMSQWFVKLPHNQRRALLDLAQALATTESK